MDRYSPFGPPPDRIFRSEAKIMYFKNPFTEPEPMNKQVFILDGDDFTFQKVDNHSSMAFMNKITIKNPYVNITLFSQNKKEVFSSS